MWLAIIAVSAQDFFQLLTSQVIKVKVSAVALGRRLAQIIDDIAAIEVTVQGFPDCRSPLLE